MVGKKGIVRGVAWSVAIVGLVVLAAGCQTVLPTAYVMRAPSQTVYLLAESDGGGSLRPPADPVDPEVPNSGGDYYDARLSPVQGLLSALDRIQGKPEPTPVAFAAKVERTMHVDLDEVIIGTVYVSNTVSSVSPRAVEGGMYRIDLRVNGVLAGGQDFPMSPTAAQNAAGWVPYHFRFPPEVAVLRPGDTIALEVTQLSGLLDLRIGTGGNHQSHARIQYYPFDPLGGATYLEKHKLVIQTPDSNVSDGTFIRLAEQASRAGAFDDVEPGVYVLQLPPAPAVGGPGLAMGAILFAPLAWSSVREAGRGRNAAVFAAILVVAIALSGCAGKPDRKTNDDSDLPPEARPSVDSDIVDIGGTKPVIAPGEVGTGEITGSVRDWRNLTLPGAYVALLGTSHFAEADQAGRFTFENVTAGKYIVRVDAEQMRSIEERIEVVANKRTVLTIKMAPLDPSIMDKFSHIHDEWGGASTKTLIDLKFTPPTSKITTSTVDGAGAPMCMPYAATGNQGQEVDGICMWPIPFPIDVKVPPGAGMIDVTLEWTGDAPELGITAYNPSARRIADNGSYLARNEGEVTRLRFFPHEADPGHQGFTNWIFNVYIPVSDDLTFGQKPLIDVGDITVRAVATRTTMPFEPAHPDLWAGTNRIKILDGASTSFSALPPNELPYTSTFVVPAKGTFVPPGTTRIEGKMIVNEGTGGPIGLKAYGLAYKPADVPASRFEEGLVPIQLGGAFPEYTFKFEVPATDVDQPYQTASNFFFYPTSDGPPYRGNSITFTFDASVFND